MSALLALLLAAGVALEPGGPPPPAAVMAVPSEMAAKIDEVAVDHARNESVRFERLVDFFHGQAGLDFSYRPIPTRAVAETFRRREGNCLAFTLAFIAAARYAGLDAYPREVHVPDHWHREGSTVLGIGHVNVGVDTPQRSSIVDFAPDLMEASRLAQPYRGRRISDERALAHFYNNRAAELLLDGETDAARRWAEQALELDRGFVSAWVTRGVVDLRQGRLDSAERHFLAALDREEDSVNALFNLVGLQRRKGDREAMLRYGRRLESLEPEDPYFLLEVGRFQRELGNPELARRAFERAVGLTESGDPMLVTSLVEVLFELGRYDEAKRHLTRSIDRIATTREPGGELLGLLRYKKKF